MLTVGIDAHDRMYVMCVLLRPDRGLLIDGYIPRPRSGPGEHIGVQLLGANFRRGASGYPKPTSDAERRGTRSQLPARSVGYPKPTTDAERRGTRRHCGVGASSGSCESSGALKLFEGRCKRGGAACAWRRDPGRESCGGS